jgi:hypothetical protein
MSKLLAMPDKVLEVVLFRSKKVFFLVTDTAGGAGVYANRTASGRKV